MIISSRCKVDRIWHHDKRVDGEGQQQMFQRSIILTLTVLLTLSACGDTSTTNEDVDATITAEIAQASLALTQPPVPTPAPTSTPPPTSTISPTSTPTPTSTPPPTPTTSTPSPTATPIPTSTPLTFSYTPCNIERSSRDSPFSTSISNYYRKWQESLHVQWTPDGSQILFTFRGTAIYAVDADGSRLQKIVDTSITSLKDNWAVGRMTHFDISPDGSQIVYSTCRYPDSDRAPSTESEYWSWEYSYEIVVANIDGTNTRRITQNDHFDNFPVWSPDGSQIAFVSDPDPDHDASEVRGRLMVYTMATGELRNITPYNGEVAPHPPAWSPDGQRIAFVRYDNTTKHDDGLGFSSVYTVRPDGSQMRKISRAFSEPSWSPDGAHIAIVAPYANGLGLFTFADNGSVPASVAFVKHNGSGYLSWLNRVYWSPDGSRILFTESWGGDVTLLPYIFDGEEDRCRHLCVASADGAFVTAASGLRLPSSTDGLRGPYIPYYSLPLLTEPLAWSADGSRIAVLTLTHSGRGSAVLYTMDRDGNDRRVLGRVGESDSPIGWKPEPVNLDSCSNGVAVPDPTNNPGLVQDCRTLLGVMDTLGGSVALELSMGWGTDQPIEEWGTDSYVSDPYSAAGALAEGVIVGGDPRRVRSLSLSGLGPVVDIKPVGVLFGRIPPELGDLSDLRDLDLGENELAGPIPPELGKLTNLEGLNLSDNYLRGNVPAELGNLTNLRYLGLSGNQLTGSIPAELGNLTNLERLDLVSTGREGNRFTGCVPMALVDKIAGFDRLGLPPCVQASDGR